MLDLDPRTRTIDRRWGRRRNAGGGSVGGRRALIGVERGDVIERAATERQVARGGVECPLGARLDVVAVRLVEEAVVVVLVLGRREPHAGELLLTHHRE